jgi:hypothetical protein
MKRKEKTEGDLGREHLAQEGKDLLAGGVVNFAKAFHQANFVNGANLVQNDLAVVKSLDIDHKW